MIPIAPSERATLIALRNFLLAILPSGVPVIRAQVNRVPEPLSPDFVLMTPLRRERLATNTDAWTDIKLFAAIAGSQLTVATIEGGDLLVGSPLFGVSVATGSTITAFGTGAGGVGTYSVSPSQTVSQDWLAAGLKSVLTPTEYTVQLDVHGPGSADAAQQIASLLRDEFATQFFTAANPAIAPLYATDPRQMPFVNAEEQIELRWIVEAHLQAQFTATVPLQFADVVTVTLDEADGLIPVP